MSLKHTLQTAQPKTSIRALLISVSVLLLIAPGTHAQNLIANGNFESGNTAFSSDYGYTSGGNCCEGQYTIRDNGSSFNGAFVNPPPSSVGSSLMMVINGSTSPNQRIWYQAVPVVPGTIYRLSLRGCTAVQGGPAILQWQISGGLIGTSITLPTETRVWSDLVAEWSAPIGVNSILLAVRDLNTASFPNDFYIDDLLMTNIGCNALIAQSPVDAEACRGGSASLNVVADGAGPFTYVWRKGGAVIDIINNSSAATETLTLNNIQAADAGSYDCVVTNACGSVTSSAANLDVYCECSTYSVLAGSIDNFALPADPATRSASFTDALNNQNPRAFLKFDEMPGVTAGTFGDQNIAQSFTNIPSDLISATLTFRAKSGPDTNPGAEGTDRMRLGFASGSGNNAAFDIRWERFFGIGNATDAFLPGVTWGGSIDRTIALDLTALPKASQQGGGTINVLPQMIASQTLDFVVDDDSAVDYMQLTGVRSGNGQKVAWVRSQPADQYACLANTESFSVTAAGTGPFTYEWRKDGVAIDLGANPSAATATFTLTNVQTSDTGSYDCIVTGTCGSVTSNAATLTVCTGDINCDEGIDFGDFLAFFNCYDAEQSCADIDGNPGVDFGDFLAFFNAYDTGC
jgi:hypothetical protein